jgi:superfamily II DNA or RNA helicase
MVSTMLRLRPYQEQAIEALRERWKEADARRLAIVLPTGGGKTVVFAHLSKIVLDAAPDKRVVVLVHTDELVRQAVDKIKKHAPGLIVGVVKAKENEVRADVIVASVQTLRSPGRMRQINHVAVVVVDECHHAVARTYMSILEHFGCFRPDGARAVGFTATLVRGDDKSLGLVWQDVAFTRSISWMVRKGYLIPPRGKAVAVPDLDLRNVKATKKDFREGELGEALADSLAPELIVEAFREHAADRKGILFAPTVASAEVFAEAFNEADIVCEVVHGGLAQDVRDAILDRHRAGLTRVVANCMVLTEGYDDPEVSCIIIARPTKSKGLYIQMVGRGLRVDVAREYADQDCIILDVVGANSTHDLCSVIDLSEKALDPEKAKSGKTLTELEDEFDAGEGVGTDAPEFYTGPVEVKDFDPLGAKSRSKVWITTRDRTYFVPAGKDAYVFIMEYPSRGRWSVAFASKDSRTALYDCPALDAPGKACACGNRCKPKQVGMTAHRALELEEAMSWAEDLAVDMGADTLVLANKNAPWRNRKASDALVKYARGLGIKLEGETDPVTGAFTCSEKAGKVSDAVTKIVGSDRIDPLVRAVRSRSVGGSK